MKNIFFVVNKEKIYAYVVSVLTIVILFFMSSVLNSDISTVKETSVNLEKNVNIEKNINVENKILEEENIKVKSDINRWNNMT